MAAPGTGDVDVVSEGIAPSREVYGAGNAAADVVSRDIVCRHGKCFGQVAKKG